jgi:hypothetical protein
MDTKTRRRLSQLFHKRFDISEEEEFVLERKLNDYIAYERGPRSVQAAADHLLEKSGLFDTYTNNRIRLKERDGFIEEMDNFVRVVVIGFRVTEGVDLEFEDHPRPHDSGPVPLCQFLRTVEGDERSAEYVVDRLLKRGERLILTGWEGAGKTVFVDQFGFQVAAGIHPITGERCEPRRVLRVDCESTRDESLERFAAFRSILEVIAPDRIEALEQNLVIRNTGGETVLFYKLAEWVEDLEIDLVVLGSLYRVTEEDTATEEGARKVIKYLESFSSDVALIIEAHSAKQSGVRRDMTPYGHSVWLRWPQFGFHLRPDGKLSRWRGDRRARDWPDALERGAPWPWMPAPKKTEEQSKKEPKERVDYVALVQEFLSTRRGEEFTKTALVSQIPGRAESITKAAETLYDDGLIESKPGARKNSVLYWMPVRELL